MTRDEQQIEREIRNLEILFNQRFFGKGLKDAESSSGQPTSRIDSSAGAGINELDEKELVDSVELYASRNKAGIKKKQVKELSEGNRDPQVADGSPEEQIAKPSFEDRHDLRTAPDTPKKKCCGLF